MDDEDYPLFEQSIQHAHIFMGFLYLGDKAFHRIITRDPHFTRNIRQNIRFINGNHFDVRKANLSIGQKKDRWRKFVFDSVSKMEQEKQKV